MMLRIFTFIFVTILCLGSINPSQAFLRMTPDSQAEVQLSFAPIVKSAAPAVVNIYGLRVVRERVGFGHPFFQQFFGGVIPGAIRERVQRSLGSGVIVDPSGIIVTNVHVIQGVKEVAVVLNDNREFEGEVLLQDPASDLAVIKIKSDQKFPHLEFSPSRTLEVGDLVLAIGNPFGVGQTVTSGIVSALDRALIDSDTDTNKFNFFIQTDADINPGNSGGALLTMDGKLAGINTMIVSRDGGSQGIGFAVPSDMVQTVLRTAKKGKDKIQRPWFGVSTQALDQKLADALDLEIPKGALVQDIYPDSPAAKSGLQTGDVIIAINDVPVDNPFSVQYHVGIQDIGANVDIDILRKGKAKTLTMTAAIAPANPAPNETEIKSRNPLQGATIANLSPALAEEIGLSLFKIDLPAVMITLVKGNSPARRFVKPGDIIRGINGKDITSVDDLINILDDTKSNWRILLERNGQKINLTVQ